MVLPLLILAAQTAGVQNVPAAPVGSGTELMVQCTAANGMMLGAAGGDTVAKGAMCLGYLEGYLDGVKGEVCVPLKPIAPVLQAYLQYMLEHRRYLDLPKAEGLRAALDASFPCRK